MTGPGGGGIKRKRFRRGEIVYAIDDLAPGVHVIATGRVKVSRLSGDGREIILRILGKGALFADGRYDSIAETIEATGTTFVANMVVRNRLERDPALGMALFEIAGERLRETQKLAERLAFNPVPSRVRTCCWN